MLPTEYINKSNSSQSNISSQTTLPGAKLIYHRTLKLECQFYIFERFNTEKLIRDVGTIPPNRQADIQFNHRVSVKTRPYVLYADRF